MARSSRSRNVMRLMPLAVLVLGAWLAGACAGRAESLSDGSSGTGGSLSAAGAGQPGNAVAAAGAPLAGAPGAGAPGAGAAGAPAPAAGAGGESDVCDNIDCPELKCSAGSVLVVPAGACCATCQCQPACSPCPVDTHEQMQAGQCCPTCVPSNPPTLSCDAGDMQYATLRAQMVDKYSHGCNVDSECLMITVSNACERCQPVALLSTAAMNFSGNTSSSAAIDCAACPVIPVPPCLPPEATAPGCVNHVCELLE